MSAQSVNSTTISLEGWITEFSTLSGTILSHENHTSYSVSSSPTRVEFQGNTSTVTSGRTTLHQHKSGVFWIRDSNGADTSVPYNGEPLSMLPGHEVTVLFGGLPGRNRYFVGFKNHNTAETYFHPALYKIAGAVLRPRDFLRPIPALIAAFVLFGDLHTYQSILLAGFMFGLYLLLMYAYAQRPTIPRRRRFAEERADAILNETSAGSVGKHPAELYKRTSSLLTFWFVAVLAILLAAGSFMYWRSYLSWTGSGLRVDWTPEIRVGNQTIYRSLDMIYTLEKDLYGASQWRSLATFSSRVTCRWRT